MILKKIILIISVTFIFLVVLTLSFVSLDTFKETIAEEVKEKYNVSLSFSHPIEHSLWAPTTLKMKGVQATLAQKKLLDIGELEVDFDLSRFVFAGDIVFKTILLLDSKIDFNDKDLKVFSSDEVSKDKRTTPENEGGSIFAIENLRVHNTTVNYDKINLEQIEIKGRISENVIVADQLLLKGYDGEVDLKGEIDLSTLFFNVSGHLTNIELGKFLALFGDKAEVVTGKASTKLELRKSSIEWSSLNGHVEIHGEKLLVTGIDLDQLLDGFIDSREIGLLDVTSFVTLGPVGLLLTNTLESGKSFSFWGKGKTQVDEVMLSLTASGALAKIEDVALRTKDKRIALVGSIDLDSYAFKDFIFHILDKDGCSRIFQKIGGTLKNPDIGITKTFVDGVISPVTDVLKRTRDLISCTPIYRGVVAHPEKSFFDFLSP